MKRILAIAAVAAMVGGVGARADFIVALTVPPSEAGAPVGSWPGATAPTEAQMEAALGFDLGLALYKVNAGDPNQVPAKPQTEEWQLAAYYTTVFNPYPDADTPGGTVTITWDGGGWWADATALLLKDGAPGGSYLWNISGWDGKERLVINNPYTGQGSISHLEIWGTPVPEPSTYLAGLFLLIPVVAQVRRMLRK